MKVFLNDQVLLSGEEWIPNESTQIESNLLTILKTLDCFNYHLDATLYYSSEGINKLIANFNALDSIADYSLTNPIANLRTILFQIGATNWNDSPKQRADHQYYYQLGQGALTHYINNTTIAEAVEYKFNNHLVCLLNLLSSDYNNTNPIHVNRSKINPPPSMNIVELEIVSEKSNTLLFIKKSRSPRKFNLNPKHGENGIGMKENKDEIVSPLKCNRNEAELILQDAVSISGSNELYGFDQKIDEFIVYKNEGNNTFHGYHPINQNEVSDSVKTFLRV